MENQENYQDEMTRALFNQDPPAEQPQYQAPQYEQPQYQAPAEQPQYQAPQYEQPQYQAPQYEQPQYQQPQYQAPQYQQPQYQVPQYQQPQYQQPQYQPAPAAKAEGGSKVGLIMSIIGFACSMLAALFGLIGIGNLGEGSWSALSTALALWAWSLIISIPGLIFGIIGLAKKGKKGFALTAVIVSAILLFLAIIFIAVISEAL